MTLPARLKLTREQYAAATRTCEHCAEVFGRRDKPKMIYGAFMRLRFCSYDCAWAASRFDHVAVFWERVNKAKGCWLWTGPLTDKGYGIHWKDAKRVTAHRYSYELHKGPLGDLHALHSCDNPQCVNPEHLRAGTARDNMMDREARGRGNRLAGARHGSAKLTEDQARYVLSSLETGSEIARRFGVSKGTIYAIRNRQNWRMLDASGEA